MFKIFVFLSFLVFNLYSFELLLLKDKDINDYILKSWYEKTYWISKLKGYDNVNIMKILKNSSNLDSAKRTLKYSNNTHLRLKKLSELIVKYDVLIYNLAFDTKFKKMLRSEVSLCLMYLNGYIDDKKFYTKLLSIGKMIKNYKSSKEKSIISLSIYGKKIQHTFKLMQFIINNSFLKKPTPVLIEEIIKGKSLSITHPTLNGEA